MPTETLVKPATTLHRTGPNVRVRREELGITKEELSTAVGISAETLSAFESGEERLPNDVILDIATALKTTFAELSKRS